MSPRTRIQDASARKPHPMRRFVRWLLVLGVLAVAGWSAYVVHCIDRVAKVDDAQPADAIAVFGAAEYNGRPSPVYHSRLDHAVSLYRRQIAPLVITLGGGGDRDSGKTEGGVGRDYLLANEIPLADIIAETHSVDTSEQVQLLASIARTRHLRRIVVVSDGTHLFRIQQLCQEAGLQVYTSPRPALGHIGDVDLTHRYVHEVLSYTAMQLGLSQSFLHRWSDGKSDE